MNKLGKSIHKMFIFVLSCVACGKIPPFPKPVVSNPKHIEKIMEQVTKHSIFCDGVPAQERPHMTTGRINCDTHEGMFQSGALLSVMRDRGIEKGVELSFSKDGRPNRAPQYVDHPTDLNGFSRDQMIGFLHSQLTNPNRSLANKFWNYISSNGYRMCKDTDGRCVVTPNMVNMAKRVWESNGWDLTPEMKLSSDILTDSALLSSAKIESVQGFQLNLVAMQILLAIRTNTVRPDTIKTAQGLIERDPNHPLYKFIHNFLTKQSAEVYDEISEDILNRSENFPSGPRLFWQWDRPSDISKERGECCINPSGHGLVFMMKLLLGNLIYAY